MENGAAYYGVTQNGYEVTVLQGCNVLDHYEASNHPFDSQQPCPSDLRPVPKRTLRKYARETAETMASEHGIPKCHVYEDLG